MRGRKRPSGGHRPHFTSETTETQRYGGFSEVRQTWGLIPDFKVNCSSQAMTAILLLLGSVWAQISPHGGYQQ